MSTTKDENTSEELYNRVKRARTKNDMEQPDRKITQISPEIKASVSQWDPNQMRLNVTPVDVSYEPGSVGHITQNRKLYKFDHQIKAIRLKQDGGDLKQMTDMRPISEEGCCVIT